ncbi:MAG: hypothetical protein K0U68_13750 [Gammaproteobacteria bacterium]|nr:hypothetical protein [Gammaproteobacteria bacterium]
MKIRLVLILLTLVITGCSKERSEYEDLLVTQFSQDQEIADYKLDPEDMADCVTDKMSEDVPGFPGSPVYEDFFKGYKLLLRPEDPREIPERIAKAVEYMGTKQKVNKARVNLTNHTLFCMPQVQEKQYQAENRFKFGSDD